VFKKLFRLVGAIKAFVGGSEAGIGIVTGRLKFDRAAILRCGLLIVSPG
jgi:hypothetical protein